MKVVLVTGATGFTGSYLVPRLVKAGYVVHGVSQSDGDIRDPEVIKEILRKTQVSQVIHLAGTTNLPDTESEVLFSVNVTGTVNLLKACSGLATPPQRIVLASSCYVYGDTGGKAAGEDALLHPATEYGRSKLEMERIARAWSPSLPVIIVRPFNYSGVGHADRFLIPKLVRAFVERAEDVSFVQENVVRDFSDVRWIADVYNRLLVDGRPRDTYNVCSGIGTPLHELVAVLERLTGHIPASRKGTSASSHTHHLVGSPRRLQSRTSIGPGRALDETLVWMLSEYDRLASSS